MCNRYGFKHPAHQLAEEFSENGLPVIWTDGLVANLAEQPQIRPTNKAPVLRPIDPADPAAGVQLAQLRWGLVPWFHKKTVKEQRMLGTNARCETVAELASFKHAYAKRRCLVPATAFYEWSGPKGDKTMWEFSKVGEPLFCFAGLWDRANCADGEIESFTILTTTPGPEAAEVHDRQPVILDRSEWATWLDLSKDVQPLLKPSSKGILQAREFSEAEG